MATSNSQREVTKRGCIVEISRSRSRNAYFSEIVSQSRMCWTRVTVRRRWLGEVPRSATGPCAKWTRAIVLGNALIALIGQCTDADAPKRHKPRCPLTLMRISWYRGYRELCYKKTYFAFALCRRIFKWRNFTWLSIHATWATDDPCYPIYSIFL